VRLLRLAIFPSAFSVAATANHDSAIVQRWLYLSLLDQIKDYNNVALTYTVWRRSRENFMKSKLLAIALFSVGFMGLSSFPSPSVAQSGPAVKMSKTGICHPRGGSYYNRTQNFTPYPSMEACIKAGGRAPKR
jgi:hypothetical protein